MKTTSIYLNALIAVFLCCSCGRTSSNRETEKIQNEANSVAEEKDLQPALGRYEGEMLISDTHRRIAAVLETRIIYRVIPSPRDPTVNISVPRLGGFLSFPLLRKLKPDQLVDYQDVIVPLGGFILAGIDMGDYNPNSHNMNLPYVVSQFGTGPFGAFQGELSEDGFVGQWNSRLERLVGTFNLVRVNNGVD
jgi:hypothetical protein